MDQRFRDGCSSRNFWRSKRGFPTGHTGFEGGRLALWPQQMGAVVHGYALERPTEPKLLALARIGEGIEHQIADIRDAVTVSAAMQAFRSDIVLHLAAHPATASFASQSFDDDRRLVQSVSQRRHHARRDGEAR